MTKSSLGKKVFLWLCGFLRLLLLTHEHQAWSGTTHKGLGPPPSITNFKNALQAQLYESIFLIEVPYQMTLAYAKLTKTKQNKKT